MRSSTPARRSGPRGIAPAARSSSLRCGSLPRPGSRSAPRPSRSRRGRAKPARRPRPARPEAQVTAGELTPAESHESASQQLAQHEASQEIATQEGSTPSGWHPEVLDGPFTTRQLIRLDEALRLADRSTGLTFSVYVGELEEPVR